MVEIVIIGFLFAALWTVILIGAVTIQAKIINKEIKELTERINILETRKPSRPIGEVYCYQVSNYPTTVLGDIGTYIKEYIKMEIFKSKIWLSFLEIDIQDSVDGYTKIKDTWFRNENIIFYEDLNPAKKAKKIIEKRIAKLEKEERKNGH